MKLKMDTSIFWITSLLMISLTVKEHNCDSLYKLNNKPPQRLVELVGILQRSDDRENKGFGIQRVPQEDGPNYEILITPNKNRQEPQDSQKIKIFVEASNIEADERGNQEEKKKRTNGEVPQRRENVGFYDVLPLSIGNGGLNIDRSQQSGDSVVKISKSNYNHEIGGVIDDLTQKDYGSYPNKRQTNWGKQSGGRTAARQPEIKEVGTHRGPSYVDQNNPRQPAVVIKNDQQIPTYDGAFSSSSQNGKRITQQIYVGEYANPVEQSGRPQKERQNPEPLEVPERNYGSYDNSYEEIRPSGDKRPNIREVEVVRPSNERRPNVNPEYARPTYNRETEDYRPSSGRNPGYRQPDESIPVYETRPSNVKETTYEEYRPTGNGGSVYSNSGYEKEGSFSSDGRRPQRGSAYSNDDDSEYQGFPESYLSENIYSNSTPLQYEPVRAFPASPCFNIFKYEGREPEVDRWYGVIYVSTNEDLIGMRLDITLDRPALLLANWLAEVKTKDGIHFTILSLTHKLEPGFENAVRIMVKFDGEKRVPYLKTINLNGRLICPVNRPKTTTTARRPAYESQESQYLATTEVYQEGPNKPFNYGNDFDSNGKRTTARVERRTTSPYEETRQPTAKPLPRPNPNGYEETDQNLFNSPTRKPPARPSHSNGKPPTDQNSFNSPTRKPPGTSSHSNGKPPSHAAKPGQGSSTSGTSQNNNRKPSKPPSTSNNRPIQGSGNFNHQGVTISSKPITCGTQSIQPQPLISHGAPTIIGQWPWHVALFKSTRNNLTFSCSGSLLNKNYVLTAGHCVTEAHTNIPVNAKSLYICAGVSYRKDCREGEDNFVQISIVYVHPKYNGTSYSSDIAVIALSRAIEFSDYVKPICLWDRRRTDIREVVGQVGTVVGWGYDENIQLTDDLRQAKMPVVSYEDCVRSYSDFYAHFASNTSYCAGYRNGSGACNGDSGGGMVFPYKDNSGVETWFIRGIVSLTPTQSGSVCDLSHYVLFTDVAQYLPWLENFL